LLFSEYLGHTAWLALTGFEGQRLFERASAVAGTSATAAANARPMSVVRMMISSKIVCDRRIVGGARR